MFVRFSTVAGNKGSADLARDVRGFAVKFYTKEGNWDLVGNNIPVFFIQDAIKFPDLIHAAKQEPDRGFPQAQTAHDNFWDFISLTPESTHMMHVGHVGPGDPALVPLHGGLRRPHLPAASTPQGKSTFVKFHWKPKLGLQSVVWNEAVKINGADPDFHRRDLWDAIQAGDFPEWELGVQLFDEDFADAFDFDVLDATKIIPEELVPVRRVGRLVLDRVVDNFFAETEQVAFCTQNVVPGIDFTNDPLLQGRNFSYLDTQLKRLGSPNFTHIPVNAPKCPFAHFQQDGHMAMREPEGPGRTTSRTRWARRSAARARSPRRGFRILPGRRGGRQAAASARRRFADHYSQARQFYISQTEVEQTHIADAFVFELSKVETPAIRARMVVAPAATSTRRWPQTVADGLRPEGAAEAAPTGRAADASGPASRRRRSASSRTGRRASPGRKVGVLVTDGVDAALLDGAAQGRSKAEGAMLELVAPEGRRREGQRRQLARGRQQKLDGGPSVLFDAVAVLRLGRGRGAAGQGPGGAGLRRRRLRPLASSSAMPRRRSRCSRRPG